MTPRYDVLIDGGHFRHCAAEHASRGAPRSERVHQNAVRADAGPLRKAVRDVCETHPTLAGYRLGKVFFYEGKHRPGFRDENELASEARYHDALRSRSIVVRLGRLNEAPVVVKGPLKSALLELERSLGIPGLPDLVAARLAHMQNRNPMVRQKGVDTLIVLDLIDLASSHDQHISVLMSGDQDLAPAVEKVHEMGGRVLLLKAPRATGIGQDLRRAVSGSVVLGDTLFATTYRRRWN